MEFSIYLPQTTCTNPTNPSTTQKTNHISSQKAFHRRQQCWATGQTGQTTNLEILMRLA